MGAMKTYNNEKDMTVKVKINGEFTEVKRGVCGIEADMGDRCEIRKFVDGDRSVPVSDRAAVTVEFIREEGDGVQDHLLAAAKSGERIEVAFGAGCEKSFEGVVTVKRICKGDIWGIRYVLEIRS
ncbi:MAG: hypothetical protein NC078_04565 [Ruminococcus sp.]|nr:hypothetical protein [Ruminococcus sp.]